MAENAKFRKSPAKHISWQIAKFFDLPTEENYFLDSSLFSLFDTEDKWYLKILPNCKTYTNDFDIILYLVKEPYSVEHRVAFKMGITYVGGKDVLSGERNEIFRTERDAYGVILLRRSALRMTINAMASDGSLTVFCTAATNMYKLGLFSYFETATRITVTTATPFDQTPLSLSTAETASKTSTTEGVTTLIENLKDLYVSKRCADVKITVKGREFLAHSLILTARSKVFYSMFNNDMLEKNSGVIEITDCDPTSFEDFLIYIYTGNLEVVSPQNATSLYETAEKYDLKDLKEECARCMVNKLTVDSFCDVLHLAAMYNETDVLMSATNFFIENARDILLTTKWTDFMTENISLGNELVLKFVNKHTKK